MYFRTVRVKIYLDDRRFSLQDYSYVDDFEGTGNSYKECCEKKGCVLSWWSVLARDKTVFGAKTPSLFPAALPLGK